MSIKRIALISLTAAVMCICSWITVPFTVPFTMQTFAVFMALVLLGGRDGTAATGVYILLGAVGFPVFSGFTGGPGHLLGPTGGYIIGFLFSGLAYILLENPVNTKGIAVRCLCFFVSLAVCYLVGTLWFVTVMGMRGNPVGFGSALALCVLPFIIPDAVKIALAYFLGSRLKKLLKY